MTRHNKEVKERSIGNLSVIFDLKINKRKRESDCAPSQQLMNDKYIT